MFSTTILRPLLARTLSFSPRHSLRSSRILCMTLTSKGSEFLKSSTLSVLRTQSSVVIIAKLAKNVNHKGVLHCRLVVRTVFGTGTFHIFFYFRVRHDDS